MGPPRKVRSDAGKEFFVKQIQSYFKFVKIKDFITQGESKSNYAERVINTLRSLMHQFMKKARSFRYIDSLQTLVSDYNKTPHFSFARFRRRGTRRKLLSGRIAKGGKTGGVGSRESLAQKSTK